MKYIIIGIVIISLLAPKYVYSSPEIIHSQTDTSHEYLFSEIEGFSDGSEGILDLGAQLNGRFDSLTLKVNAENLDFSCNYFDRLWINVYQGPYINIKDSYALACEDDGITTQGSRDVVFRVDEPYKYLNFDPGSYYRIVGNSFYREGTTLYGDGNKNLYFILKSNPILPDPYDHSTQSTQEKTISTQNISSHLIPLPKISNTFLTLNIKPEQEGEFSSFVTKAKMRAGVHFLCSDAETDNSFILYVRESIPPYFNSSNSYQLMCDTTIGFNDMYVPYKLKEGEPSLIFKEGYKYEFFNRYALNYIQDYVLGDENNNLFYVLRVKATTTQPVEEPENEGASSVIFIPGLQGSRLHIQEGSVLNKVWEPNRNLDLEKLYLNQQGDTTQPVVVGEPIDTIKVNNIPTFISVYEKLFNLLDSLVTEGVLQEWESFPYDWRKDLEKIVTEDIFRADGTSYRMIDELERIAQSSPTGKVTLITHSNGGLIARFLSYELEKLGKSDLIENVVMIGTPELGTPKAMATLLHGEGVGGSFGLILRKQKIRELASNMPSAYTLLPSFRYFEKVADPVVVIENTPKTKQLYDLYGESINDGIELSQFLISNEGKVASTNNDTIRPIKANEHLLTQSKERQTFLNSWYFPENVNVVRFAGWGIDTIKGIKYYEKNTTTCLDILGCSQFGYRPLLTLDGDKTVVTASADEKESSYYLNLSLYNKDKKTSYSHMDMAQFPPLLSELRNFIASTTVSTNTYITTTKPEVQSNSKRLLLSVHSPATIIASDRKGNQAGKISFSDSDIEQEINTIPNTEYFEFGEGAYLSFDPDTTEHIVLNAQNTETIAISIGEAYGDKEYSFPSFEVSSSTNVYVSISEDLQESTLDVDMDSDNTIDTVISIPSQTENPSQPPSNPTPEQSGGTSSQHRGGSGSKDSSFDRITPQVKGVSITQQQILQEKMQELLNILRVFLPQIIENKHKLENSSVLGNFLTTLSHVLTSYLKNTKTLETNT